MRSVRCLPIFTLAALAGTAHAVDKSWNTGAGVWNTAGNWFSAGVPAATDNVFIGNRVAALNAFVTLNVTATVANLTITDGMTLRTNNLQFTVTGDTSISGSNSIDNIFYPSRIIVTQSPSFYDFITTDLNLSDGAYFELSDGPLVRVTGQLNIGATASIYGEGFIGLAAPSGRALVLNGHLQPGIAGLTISQTGGGRIDLDGDAVGDILNITLSRIDNSGFASLTINGDQLSDAFQDNIWLSGGNALNMNLDNGWTMTAGNYLRASRGLNGSGPAQLTGGHWTMSGAIDLTSTSATLFVSAPTTFTASASAELGESSTLLLNNASTILGGSYEIGQSALIRFQSSADIRGGNFTTVSDNPTDGSVAFIGATSWNGDPTFGAAAQIGDATVDGPTTINARRFVMAAGPDTDWTLYHPLTINAEAVGLGSQNFLGRMLVTGNPPSKLTVNLADNAAWNMQGDLTLEAGAIPITRWAGTRADIRGRLTATGFVEIAAPLTFHAPAMVQLTAAIDHLRFAADAVVHAGVNILGQGELRNLAGRTLTLENNLTIPAAGVWNDGRLRIATGPGRVVVDRVRTTSTLEVDIGGDAAGVTHDLLVATGVGPGDGASLSGALRVNLVNDFLPTLNQPFTIIDARNGVTGTFTSIPESVVNSWIVEWTAEYAPNSVTVRATTIRHRCGLDFNDDGFVDFFDYADYVTCFESSVCPPGKTADFNNDGFLDFFDYDAFVEAFESDC